MKKIIVSQFIILFLGTLFAWSTFVKELVAWLDKIKCETGCFAGPSPFLTPCFFGALFFTAAFILSIILATNAKTGK